jgi:hypothetical protein
VPPLPASKGGKKKGAGRLLFELDEETHAAAGGDAGGQDASGDGDSALGSAAVSDGSGAQL